MIRINLLAVREKRTRSSGTRVVVVILTLLGVMCAGLFYVHSVKAAELSARQKELRDDKGKIDKLKRDVGDIDKLKATKAELEQQQKVLDALEVSRSGPVRVLADVQRVLTPPIDSRAREQLAARGASPTWNTQRLTVLSFVEDNREVTLNGVAKANDDVAEFLKRLASSEFFEDVNLQWTKLDESKDLGGLKFVRFNITARISYVGKGMEDVLLMATDKKKKG